MTRRLNEADSAKALQRAVDAVAAMPGVESIEELNALVEKSFKALGFDVFIGIRHVAPGGTPNVQVLFGQTHAAWEARYLDQDYQRDDAVIDVALAQKHPFFWSETGTFTTISPKAQHIFDEAREFGLNNGLLTPIHHLDGAISSVLLTGSHVEVFDLQTRVIAHMLAIYFSSSGERLLGEKHAIARQNDPLTGRQLEMLRWVRAGKSSTDIGDILNLSPRTVDEHVQIACNRLGVRTRVQAVTEAALRGLINL